MDGPIKDDTTGDWVIIAPTRSKRPNCTPRVDATEQRLPEYDPECPFCPGNEPMTPPETLSYAGRVKTRSCAWSLRAFSNAFPVMPGAHEVIVESPNHSVPFFLQGREQTEKVVRAYIEKFSTFAKDPSNKMICIFRNHGKNAGASLQHPHSQIIAAHFESPEMAKRRRAAAEFIEKTGKCPLCALAEKSKRAGLEIFANSGFSAFCPPASKHPYETWISPRAHQSSILELESAGKSPLAEMLVVVLSKIHLALGNPDFNMTLQSAVGKGEDDFHWFFQIVPRISSIAGFELGTGIYINAVRPSEAAKKLRNSDME